MKRIFACLLLVALLVSAIPPYARAATVDAGGNLDYSAPTKAQIAAMWQKVTQAKTLYTKEPSVTAPYKTGELSKDFLQSGVTYLNYVRYVANLPQVQLDAELNKNAQHGAVLLAAVNELNHYPAKPKDMDKKFYDQGFEATTTSNLSGNYGYAPTSCLQNAISGCMDDYSSRENLSCVGHRRWLLNPTLLNVGFGYAASAQGWNYTDIKIWDESGKGCDYNYISWPASGNHPTNLFDVSAPWSVTLNPKKYQVPQLEKVKITLTREADGKKWIFNASTGKPVDETRPYMTVNNDGYGVPNCIIFHPGSHGLDAYQGVYTVDISGLTTKDGKAAKLHYQVDFFDVTKVTAGTGEIIKKVNGVWKYYRDGVNLRVTTLVKHSGCWYYVKDGVVDFDYAGFVKFKGDQYFVQNGKIISNTTGLVKCNGVWYYIVNGKLASKTTTLVKYNGEWFYVVNGKVASGTTTLVNYNGGWYYMVKGKLAAKTTTLVKYNGEWFYVVGGKVASATTALVNYNGGWYYMVKGKLAAKTTTLVKNNGTWYYVQNGSVNFGYTGAFRFNGSIYQIKNGRLA